MSLQLSLPMLGDSFPFFPKAKHCQKAADSGTFEWKLLFCSLAVGWDVETRRAEEA